VESITFENVDNHFVVARFRVENSGGQVITITGKIPLLAEGERLRLRGSWRNHPRFGKQFQVEEYERLPFVSLEGLRRYLSSRMVKGIGPHYAGKIVRKFGLETIRILDEEPERLRDIPGIGEKRLEEIKRAWQAQRESREVMLFLAELGIGPAMASRIYREYGHQTLEVLRKNPYQLCQDIRGIGFLSADKIARRMGVAAEEPARIENGLKYVLQRATEDGHVFLPRDELMAQATQLLNVDEKITARICEELIRLGHLVEVNGAVYLSSLYRAERELAEKLVLLVEYPKRTEDPDRIWQTFLPRLQLSGFSYTDVQKQAILTAFTENVLLITGGPGTGKTTVVNGILRFFEFLNIRCELAAPTGRAAKRLEETTGHPAKTVHRLLEYDPALGAFKRNAKNPLQTDALIVDEASMLDLLLAHRLVQAISPGTRLILVGDVDQLPSVGPGSVLRDLIQSGKIPTVFLREIFRQAADSLIVRNAHRVNRGMMPEFTRKEPTLPGTDHPARRLLPKDDYGDFLFVREEDPERILSIILELCSEKLPARYGYNPVRDIQVITPIYRGELGADNLNRLLQARLNPGNRGVARGNVEFRLGDRIMQLRNNYDKGVFNGDLGTVSHIFPDRGRLVVQFTEPVEYDFSELDEITLAYAITVHKSQGSEYPVVIMPITTHHYVMLQRNLLYTAMTRAKELMMLIGTKRAIAIAVNNNRVAERHTRLAEWIRQEKAAGTP